jgi:hypothetical protein
MFANEEESIYGHVLVLADTTLHSVGCGPPHEVRALFTTHREIDGCDQHSGDIPAVASQFAALVRDWHALCIASIKSRKGLDVNPSICLLNFRRIVMNTLKIKDLPMTEDLDRKALAALRGGIGRTPVQVLAWEASGQPATWQGMVLGDDGRLHLPPI